MEDKKNIIITLLSIIIVILVCTIIGVLIYKHFNNSDAAKDEVQDEKMSEITYDYYYYEKEDYYLPNNSDTAVIGLLYNKLYLLSNNTYYLVHNNLSVNSIEYDYGTYEKNNSIIKLSNTKTFTTENNCYYDDGPYEYNFDLDSLHYTDSFGYVDITFNKVSNDEDITNLLPTYSVRCADLLN